MPNRDEHEQDEAQAMVDAQTPDRDDDVPAGGPDEPAADAGDADGGRREASDDTDTGGAEPPEASSEPWLDREAVDAAQGASAGERAPFEGAEGEEEPTLPPQEVRAIVEALVFASPQPVTPRQIGQVLASVSKPEWQAALQELRAEYAADGRGLQLVEVAGGWQITTRPEYNDWVRELLDPKTPTRLSIQALETLAVIAYKQPVTLPEVIALRGVKSGGVIRTLLEKRLIRIVGRKEVVGRPMLYGTTKDFLLHFGLKDVGELPKIEEFAEVLGEEVDVAGLKKAIEAPAPVEVPLGEAEPAAAAEAPTEAPSAAADAPDEAAEDA
jgi:segregation and condensation protein B